MLLNGGRREADSHEPIEKMRHRLSGPPEPASERRRTRYVGGPILIGVAPRHGLGKNRSAVRKSWLPPRGRDRPRPSTPGRATTFATASHDGRR